MSYEQWLWSALMINQFEDQQFGELCKGHNTTLQAVAGLLPGQLSASPAQLSFMSGAPRRAASAAHAPC